MAVNSDPTKDNEVERLVKFAGSAVPRDAPSIRRRQFRGEHIGKEFDLAAVDRAAGYTPGSTIRKKLTDEALASPEDKSATTLRTGVQPRTFKDEVVSQEVVDSAGGVGSVSMEGEAFARMRAGSDQFNRTGEGPVADSLRGIMERDPSYQIHQRAQADIAAGKDVDLEERYAPLRSGQSRAIAQYDKRISTIEGELRDPGLGFNQSQDEMRAETRTRKALRRELDTLLKRRESEAGREAAATGRKATREAAERKEGLAERKFAHTQRKDIADLEVKVQKELRAAEESGKRFSADRLDKASANFKQLVESRTDDPEEQILLRANYMSQLVKNPDKLFNTAEGTAAKDIMKRRVVDQMTGFFGERGIPDWIMSKLGLSEAGEGSINPLDMNFKGWKLDKGEIMLPEFLVGNEVFDAGGSGKYVYADDFSAEERYMIEQMILAANPKQRKSIRKGQ